MSWTVTVTEDSEIESLWMETLKPTICIWILLLPLTSRVAGTAGRHSLLVTQS